MMIKMVGIRKSLGKYTEKTEEQNEDVKGNQNKNQDVSDNDEEIEEEYKNLSELYKTDIDKVKAIISREGQTKDIIARKAMNLVRDEAVVEVNKDEKAAKPAKTTKSTKAKAADKEADAEKEAAPYLLRPPT